MGIGISRFVDNYKIYIDTCSLLEDGALDFLERSKFTLKYAGKKVYIMQDVLGELKKHKKIGKDDLPERAEKILEKINEFKEEGILAIQNVGSEENKIRPVVVLQANAYNFKSPVFTCAIISTSPVTIPDIQIPISGHYTYNDDKGVVKTLSGAIDLGQIKTIAKERIVSQKVCTLKNEVNDIDSKLLNIFGLTPLLTKKENTIKSLQGKVEFLKTQLKGEA